MVLGSRIVANYVKFTLFFCLVAYGLVFKSKYSKYLPLYFVNDFIQKNTIKRPVKVILLGGSNMSVGVSAKGISSKYSCLNLGLFGELGSFSRYKNWLNSNVSADILIYSPAILWSNDFSQDRASIRPNSFFNMPPLISQLKAILILNFFDNFYFDDFGDCKSFYGGVLSDFILSNSLDYRSDSILSVELNQRVAELKKITNAKLVLIRVPPVYSSNSNCFVLAEFMHRRVAFLKTTGLRFIGSTYVSNDTALFSDNFHPNNNGRSLFTYELIESLCEYDL